MAKIHITLVGGQPVPVYQGIKYSNPDIVYYICSQQSQRNISTIKAFFKDVESREILLKPVELNEVYEKIKELKKEVISPDNEVSINLSGGTKHWTIAFFDSFHSEQNVTIFALDQNCLVHNFLTMEHQESVSVDLTTRFILHGCKLIKKTNFSDYTDNDKRVADKLFKIWNLYNNKNDKNNTFAFTNLLSGINEKTLELVGKSVPKSFKSYVKSLQKGHIRNKQSADEVKFSKPGTVNLTIGDNTSSLQSEHAVDLAFFTGWFEYKVAAMMSKWQYSKDILCGCEMQSLLAKGNDPLNEFDVLVYTGTRFFIIECKTTIAKPTDIEKFAKAARNYTGMSTTAVFITYNPIDKKCEDMMKFSNIRYFCMRTQSEQNILAELDKLVSNINEV